MQLLLPCLSDQLLNQRKPYQLKLKLLPYYFSIYFLIYAVFFYFSDINFFSQLKSFLAMTASQTRSTIWRRVPTEKLLA